MIEILSVISLVSILIFFSLPVVSKFDLFRDNSGQAGDIIRLVEDLKLRARKKNLDYVMHIDMSDRLVWVTHEKMDDSQASDARDEATPLAESLMISDIEFPVVGTDSDNPVAIRFRKQGYSDSALIHIKTEDQSFTLKIHPFLSRVEQLDRYVSFEDCI